MTCAVTSCDAKAVAKGLCKRHWHKARRYGSPEGGAGWRKGESLAWLVGHIDHTGDACLIWPFTRAKSGYGVIYIGGKQRQAHREVCIRAHGPAPTPKHQAAHSCGKGHEGCVNPMHVRWDTPAGNQADRIAHGTSPRGNGNGRAKLSAQDVLAIRDRVSNGEMQSAVARDFDVSPSTIHLIKTGRNWNWLKEQRT